MDVGVWFDRKFSFDFSVELFPNLCVRLRGAPARLEELTRSIAPEVLTAQPGGKWSIQENAGHLLDLEPLWDGRTEDFRARVETLRAADLTNRRTREADHNRSALENILGAFRDARTRWIDRLEKLPPEAAGQTSLHPRLKTPMRLVDHLDFVAEHDDHHLARIWEIRRNLTAPR